MPVLVVDDHGATIQIIRALLRQVGLVEIDDANSGAEALAKMRLKRYELVISEWQLKPMTGNELLREVRCDQGLKRIPFIVIGGIPFRECNRGEEGGRKHLHRQTLRCTNAQGQDRGRVSNKDGANSGAPTAIGCDPTPASERRLGRDLHKVLWAFH